MNKVKIEYFELIRRLNKSNKTSNEETTLSLTIDNTNANYLKLYAILSTDQKILLCQKTNETNWRPAHFSGLDQLEKFVCSQLNYITENSDIDLILRNLFKQID